MPILPMPVCILFNSSRKNFVIHINIKIIMNYSRLNRYNFRTVIAIDFLFSTLHTTSFLFGKIDSEVFHLLRASVTTSDTPNRPQLSAGNAIHFNLVYTWKNHVPIDLSCSLIFT